MWLKRRQTAQVGMVDRDRLDICVGIGFQVGILGKLLEPFARMLPGIFSVPGTPEFCKLPNVLCVRRRGSSSWREEPTP